MPVQKSRQYIGGGGGVPRFFTPFRHLKLISLPFQCAPTGGNILQTTGGERSAAGRESIRQEAVAALELRASEDFSVVPLAVRQSRAMASVRKPVIVRKFSRD
jgi:hypothetical protein